MIGNKLLLSFIASLAFAGLLLAKDWWIGKQYQAWTERDVKRMLDDSPWGKVHTVALVGAMSDSPRTFESTGRGDLEREKQVSFHIRFLTARPIRMAIARDAMLSKGVAISAEAAEAFVQQVDDNHIVVALTLSAIPPTNRAVSEFWSSLLRLSTPALATNTLLATRSGKRMYLTRYERSGEDGAGAKYYFSRRLEDGTPLIQPGEKEVRFETVVGSARVWMQFDPRQMVFEGKLEI